jgi:hypothetical protein
MFSGTAVDVEGSKNLSTSGSKLRVSTPSDSGDEVTIGIVRNLSVVFLCF